jgi:hypothetical protein
MPPTSKAPRLWLRKARRDKQGRVTHAAAWIIRDERHRESTGCGAGDRRGAEAKLEAYLNRKHTAAAKKSVRDPAQISVADVLALYGSDIAPSHARPHETAQRIERLLSFFGTHMLSDINGGLCRAYARGRETQAGARRDLEELRAAINHHRAEGHCDRIVTSCCRKSRSRERRG